MPRSARRHPLSTRVPASERTSQRLGELLNGLGDEEVGSQVIRLGIRKIVEEALEAELRDAIGRGYYEHGAEPGGGYRNGTRIGRLKTAEGLIEYGAPQVADRGQVLSLLEIEEGDLASDERTAGAVRFACSSSSSARIASS